MRSVLFLLFVFSGYLANAQYYTENRSVFIGFGGSTYEFAQENISHTFILGGIEQVAVTLGEKPIRTYGGEANFGFALIKQEDLSILNVGAKYGMASYEKIDKKEFISQIDISHNVDVVEYGGFAHWHFYNMINPNNARMRIWSVYLPIEYVQTDVKTKFHMQGEFNHPEMQDGNNLIREYETSAGSYGYGLGVEFYISKHWNLNAQYVDYKEFVNSSRLSLSARYTF